MENETLYIVNENGEVLDYIKDDYSDEDIRRDARYVKIKQGDVLIREGSMKYLTEAKALKYHFCKLNNHFMTEYIAKFSILIYLIDHLSYSENKVVYDNHKTVKYKDLYKVCNASKITVERQIKKLEQLDILHIIKERNKKSDGYVILNPYLVHKGKKVFITTLEEFANSKFKEEVEEYEKKLKNQGRLV